MIIQSVTGSRCLIVLGACYAAGSVVLLAELVARGGGSLTERAMQLALIACAAAGAKFVLIGKRRVHA